MISINIEPISEDVVSILWINLWICRLSYLYSWSINSSAKKLLLLKFRWTSAPVFSVFYIQTEYTPFLETLIFLWTFYLFYYMRTLCSGSRTNTCTFWLALVLMIKVSTCYCFWNSSKQFYWPAGISNWKRWAGTIQNQIDNIVLMVIFNDVILDVRMVSLIIANKVWFYWTDCMGWLMMTV